ncbi:MAG TPA: hypothetical protein VLJ60_02510, partial [bacterium]|nr:hypothetical protein [bacterium]
MKKLKNISFKIQKEFTAGATILRSKNAYKYCAPIGFLNQFFRFVKFFLISSFLIFLSCANTHNLLENKQPSAKAKYMF